jgi:hypothetical protein
MSARTTAVLVLTLLFSAIACGDSFAQAVSSGPRVSVTVDARHPWVDSGLTVQKGERVSFEAEGAIQWGTEAGQVAGPEGHDSRAGKLGKGGLIGRVGLSGKPFPIGRTRTPIVMPKGGELFLGVNDFVFGDNAGAFAVTIIRGQS